MSEQALITAYGAGFLKGNFRLMRTQFNQAGQDSFTNPPMQNTDLFSKLTNILPPTQGDLDRRWGYDLYATADVPTTVTSGVPISLYQNQATQTRSVILPVGTQAIQVLEEDGTTALASVFTPTAQPVRMLSSRSYGYVSSGNPDDYKKWNGGTDDSVVTNWGIDATNLDSAIVPGGLEQANCSVALNDPTQSVYGNVGYSEPWTLNGVPDGIGGNAAIDNTGAPSATVVSQGLALTDFGFAIPSGSVITSIRVNIDGTHVPFAGYGFDFEVSFVNLVYNGAVVGMGAGGLIASGINQGNIMGDYGGAGSVQPPPTWNANPTSTMINDSTFGLVYSYLGESATVTQATITVAYACPVCIPGSTGSGDINLSVGREYCVAFLNSITGHYSDITPFGPSTGPLTDNNIEITDIPVCLDTQVNYKVLLATADGGDQTTLYFVDQLSNEDDTYTDDTPEETLLLSNIFLEQDIAGNTLGLADNDRPPIGGLFPVAHRGRLYLATPTSLYYSKSEAELLTSTGTLTGKYEEAWPPLNYFTVATGAETLTGQLSDGQVLYIGTNTRVLRLYGDGPNTYQEPESLFQHVGVLNQDVWKMVFLQGNPLGAMWLTPDYRIIGSDFNTYTDVGQPIQDILDTINAAAINTAWSSYVGISNWNLWILAIPTDDNTTPDTLLVFDLKSRMWYVWEPTDVMLGGLYWVTLEGQPQFVTFAESGKLYKWNPSSLQDRVGNTPVDFTATIESSWQDFTDSAARKYLNEIEIVTGDPELLVTIEGASTKANFDTPHTVVANATLRAKPLGGELFVSLAPYTTKDRYYRYRLVASDSGTNLLRGVNIQGGVISRL